MADPTTLYIVVSYADGDEHVAPQLVLVTETAQDAVDAADAAYNAAIFTATEYEPVL